MHLFSKLNFANVMKDSPVSFLYDSMCVSTIVHTAIILNLLWLLLCATSNCTNAAISWRSDLGVIFISVRHVMLTFSVLHCKLNQLNHVF